MNEWLKKVWSWIEKNRWTVILPLVGLVLWIVAVGCTPTASSPITGDRVDSRELAAELEEYIILHELTLKKFEVAQAEIEEQKAAMEEMKQIILAMASGSVADIPGLLQLLLGSSVLGLFADNVRKNGVIGGLKRNAR